MTLSPEEPLAVPSRITPRLKKSPKSLSILFPSVPNLVGHSNPCPFVVSSHFQQHFSPSPQFLDTRADFASVVASIDPVLLTALANPKDRLYLIRVEVDVQRFLKNSLLARLDFPPMSSYQRLMVHRVAEYYLIEHAAADFDNSRRAIVLFKSVRSRFPNVQLMNITEEAALVARDCKSPSRKIPSPSGLILFKVPEEISETEIEETGSYEPDPDMPPLNSAEPSKQVRILQRNPANSPDKTKNSCISSKKADALSPSKQIDGSNSEKTFEEREKEYALARARIFNHENLEDISAEIGDLSIDHLGASTKSVKAELDCGNESSLFSHQSVSSPSEHFSSNHVANSSGHLGHENKSCDTHFFANNMNGSYCYPSVHQKHLSDFSVNSTLLNSGTNGPGDVLFSSSSQPFVNYGHSYQPNSFEGDCSQHQSSNGVSDADSPIWQSNRFYPAYDGQWYPCFGLPRMPQSPHYSKDGVSPIPSDIPYGPLPVYPLRPYIYSPTSVGYNFGNLKSTAPPHQRDFHLFGKPITQDGAQFSSTPYVYSSLKSQK